MAESVYRKTTSGCKERMRIELENLDQAIESLLASIFRDPHRYVFTEEMSALPHYDQALLTKQLAFMEGYQRVLMERWAREPEQSPRIEAVLEPA